MNTPEWTKPGIYGAIVGAVLVSVVGFTWGGWVTGSTAEEQATTMAHNDVVAALVPVCLDIARNDPQRAEKLESIRAVASYKRREVVMEAGWATVPGSDSPDRDVAQACLSKLEL